MSGLKYFPRPIRLKRFSTFLRVRGLPKILPVSCGGKALSIFCAMIKIIFLNGTFGNILSSIRGISLNRMHGKSHFAAREIFFSIISLPSRNFKDLLPLPSLWSVFRIAISLLSARPDASPTSASMMRTILSAGSVSSANRSMRSLRKIQRFFSFPPSTTSASSFSSS